MKFSPGRLEVLYQLGSLVSNCILSDNCHEIPTLPYPFDQELIKRDTDVYIGDRKNLVNEDEGLPAKSSHAQCLTLWQLSSNPRQERRYLMMVDIAMPLKRKRDGEKI